MSDPRFLRTEKVEDTDPASNSNVDDIDDLRQPTSSPKAQPWALALRTQPDPIHPKNLRAAEVFGGSTNPFRRGPYSLMAPRSTAVALQSLQSLCPENNPPSDQARLSRAQTQ
ncbi:hypothetical protein FPQ18DRAFT_380221 [Pyronema domesticum]|nr:hypothetical protein FPQ18DRAFT_380221 [Pyronema domesticum]